MKEILLCDPVSEYCVDSLAHTRFAMDIAAPGAKAACKESTVNEKKVVVRARKPGAAAGATGGRPCTITESFFAVKSLCHRGWLASNFAKSICKQNQLLWLRDTVSGAFAAEEGRLVYVNHPPGLGNFW